ncbi:MAG: hypothetical protein HQ481_19715 [Alphaproteobacteria bacterium]|nr:hypothetical protein [Alphaproteobacteria bacterium]
MRDMHVLTPREAAEQTGLSVDAVLTLAADHSRIAKTIANTVRIDPWALDAALTQKGFKNAA